MTPTKEKLLRFTDEALTQASELSDRWVGTLIGNIIDQNQTRLKEAVEESDFTKILEYLGDLAQIINFAEESTI